MPLRSFNTILDECLLAVQRGESVEACLARYPRQADRLRPLLALAEKVRKTPQTAPKSWSQTAAWSRVRQRAADLRSRRRGLHLGVSYAAWLRPIAVAAVLVCALLAGGGATALAAQSSLPDSPLYRVKLASEDVRLWFVFDDAHKAEVLVSQSRERTQEITSMNAQGKRIPANVLSALRDRNERAAALLAEHPEEADLYSDLTATTAEQEELLVALQINVSHSALDEYAEAVATVHNIRLQRGSGGFVSIRPEEISAGIQTFSGSAEPIGGGVWNVGGVEVRIDGATIGYTELDKQPGATVRLSVGKNSRGDLHALSVSILQTGLAPGGSVVSGELEAVSDEGITVAGQFIRFAPNAIRPKLKKGEKIEVTVDTTANGAVAASVRQRTTATTTAESVAFTFEGAVEGNVNKKNEWTIGGLTFTITSTTSFDLNAGDVENDTRVLVDASNEDGRLLAHKVTVLASTVAPEQIYLVGTFQGTHDGLWKVSGLPVVAPEAAAEDPAIDSLIAIDGRREGGEIVASQSIVLETPEDTGIVGFQGAVTSINGSLLATERGGVRVTSTARVSGGAPIVGGRILAWGRLGQDGVLQAFYARVLDQTSVMTTAAPPPLE